MKRVFNIFIYIGIIATHLCCSSEDWTEVAVQEYEYACRLVLDMSYSDFNDKTTRGTDVTADWTDGDCIYLLFANGDKQIEGRAVYRSTSNEWTLYYNEQLPTSTPSMCKAHYFRGDYTADNSDIALSASTAVYVDNEGSYRKEAGVVYVRLALKPSTGRVRFYGESEQEFSLIGVKYNVGYNKSTGDVETSSDNLTTKIGDDGYTPYLYIELVNVDRTLTVFYNNKRFTKQCQNDVLKLGQSGYMQLPTEASYEGWTMAYVAKPVVTNIEVLEVGCPASKVYAEISSTGNGTISECGFCYSKASSPTIEDTRVLCPIGQMSLTAEISDLTVQTKYHVRAYAINEAGVSYSEEIFFTADYASVDLGLPSGILWAHCNVGASQPEEYGDYYAWGETNTQSSFISSACTTYGMTIKELKAQNFIDIFGALTSEHDAAYMNWGANWRIPTLSDFTELVENCTATWTTVNGVKGQLFTGANGNSIFMPAAGYYSGNSAYSVGSVGHYWSSIPHEIGAGRSFFLIISTSNPKTDYDHREYGRSVRPVKGNSMPYIKISETSINFGKSADSTVVQIETNIEWIEEHSDSWITVAQENVNTLKVYVEENTTKAPRTATISLQQQSTGEEMAFIVIYQDDEQINGHEYVDLGLSVKWATCNIGAEKPTDYGDYYAWGGTTLNSSGLTGGEMVLKLLGYLNNKNLNFSYDAARKNWGATWRMPTIEEIKELISKTTATWTAIDGVSGYVLTSKQNGNSIFLPVANDASAEGSYWSSTANDDKAYILCFDPSILKYDIANRGEGSIRRNIRPVFK